MKEISLVSCHKAISVIELKLEGQLIKRRPEFQMEDRLMLHRLDIEDMSVKLDDGSFELNDSFFPTLDSNDPYKLSIEEEHLLEELKTSFLQSEKLQKHSDFLFRNGSM